MFEFQRSDYSQGEGSHQYSHALSENSTHLKHDGGKTLYAFAEPVAHVIVGTVDVPFVKGAHEIDSNNDSGGDGSEPPLEVGEVPRSRIDHSRYADESDATYLGCDDRSAHRWPRQGSTAEEEILNA